MLDQAVKDENLHNHLEKHNITWKFNLSRAPWWGGHFERLIGVVKKAMHKTIGGATLDWQELTEVILDIEIQINRRPLCYMEDDVELPTLTPSIFLFQRSSQLPEQEPWREDEKSLRKRAKFLIACKKNLWNRWKREYLTALREKHNMTHQTGKLKVSVGDVVIVKSDDKNREKLAPSHRATNLSGKGRCHSGSGTEDKQRNPRETCPAPLPYGACQRKHQTGTKTVESKS